MCLKIFYRYTFSNREAFDRITSIMDAHGLKSFKGVIYKVREFGPYWENRDWNKLSYDDLVSMKMAGGFFTLYYYRFNNWKSWREAMKNIEFDAVVFGEVVVEMQ